METYAESKIPKEDIVLFHKIKEVIDAFELPKLENNSQGEEIFFSCHMLAAAIGEVFVLKVQSGHYASFYEHSWVETKHGNCVDVYPVATVGGPVLVDKEFAYSPLSGLYKEEDISDNIQGSLKRLDYKRIVNETASSLRKIL